MSSVQAVTQDLVFVVKVASFYPVEKTELLYDFTNWIQNKASDYHIIIYKTALESKEKNT